MILTMEKVFGKKNPDGIQPKRILKNAGICGAALGGIILAAGS